MDIFGILSLIFGALGTLSSYWYIGIIPGIIGVVLGIVGLIESYFDNRFSIMGLLLSVFSVIASIFFTVSDLDSGALVVKTDKIRGEKIESVRDDDFMRFHQEGWTPEQVNAREDIQSEEEAEKQKVGQEEEKITPYWVKEAGSNAQVKTKEEDSNIEESQEESSQSALDQAEERQKPEPEEIEPEREENNMVPEQETAGRWELYRDDNIAISYDGMYRDDFFDGYNVKLIVENLSNRTFTVQCRETSVNGYMVEPICSIEVSPGKKSVDTILIYGEDADRAPYGSVNSIETKFVIFESENAMQSYQTGNVRIK